MTINENKQRFNLNHDGKRYPIRLPGWTSAQLKTMAGRQKSTFLVDAIFSFARANDIHTDDLDMAFDAFDMNMSDVANAAIVYSWTTNLKKINFCRTE